MPLEFREVGSDNWSDLVTLMESRGGPGYCWCLAWRDRHAVRRTLDLEGRREAMHARVDAGTPVGILAYDDGEPAGWCSIAPRDTYLELGGLDDGEGIWSLVCFFVPVRHRGRGLAESLLGAAVRTARDHGARAVEAYPVDPDSPSYRFMGFVPMFERAGFREVGRAGTRRHVMRLSLSAVGAARRSPRA